MNPRQPRNHDGLARAADLHGVLRLARNVVALMRSGQAVPRFQSA
ncbi:hypothetical protein vBBaMIFTN7_50 [Bordetella phage vB_BaM-IFTN7]|nr:hypothetical protein vBBaMIFTN1_46 [Bordetella phage vB_BaM-IFTN1]UOK17239.1 hypothetical protein vBBaMIFTN4_47 [Bordetella phage vB_BaM-IFTN4]UOK17314.1 hypothetical protein vBBaMIFTN5_50 [Bordetella phage vB_BaM-IFTN5]UOK17447.1 hypothetical protein vBBaMIFTN7_50 [Bordetella phage vB_BaM-IFTN7]UOK17518.1 hypothetical protein vBBaMIFTN8_53 [Bordetella phage vB_BaM-IFTN8]UOK17589.1 hypothetical protein vBBaMIFTN9_48 [Bordetella phage vB_BaM-IFTN9]